METETIIITPKKSTLRHKVFKFIEAIDNGSPSIDRYIEDLRSAVTPVKKEKPAKARAPKKESKHYDSMILNPRETQERVIHYLVTKEGREAIKLMGEASIVRDSMLSLTAILL